ncbi:hypothetical protein QVD17_10089 [Tagetes erecta]|uniref:Uncharacterized protein n=1 Tax=Tagetes erecta TaxID=13708 RepID=A0AAD8L272_TARER|nr:hypothetical protein QVD17_10089 [Tagetes erecta]
MFLIYVVGYNIVTIGNLCFLTFVCMNLCVISEFSTSKSYYWYESIVILMLVVVEGLNMEREKEAKVQRGAGVVQKPSTTAVAVVAA